MDWSKSLWSMVRSGNFSMWSMEWIRTYTESWRTKIRQNAKVNVERAQEIEQETRHDVVAFTRQVSETLGEERKWVHYGLTSTDVVDTALSFVIKQANDIIEKDLERFIDVLAEKAKNYKYTLMMGRTHGVHAEPTTFGVKMALWYTEMQRNLQRFKQVREEIEVGKWVVQ